MPKGAITRNGRTPDTRTVSLPGTPRGKAMRLVNQNWWFTTLLVSQHKYCPPLTKDIKCDVAIVGGGFAGVAAAAQFLRKGLRSF